MEIRIHLVVGLAYSVGSTHVTYDSCLWPKIPLVSPRFLSFPPLCSPLLSYPLPSSFMSCLVTSRLFSWPLLSPFLSSPYLSYHHLFLTLLPSPLLTSPLLSSWLLSFRFCRLLSSSSFSVLYLPLLPFLIFSIVSSSFLSSCILNM